MPYPKRLIMVNFTSANKRADNKTTTQSFTTPATRIVKALVCVITRKTERLSAKVHRELSTSITGGKFHDSRASIFGFSRKIHGMSRQRALHQSKKLIIVNIYDPACSTKIFNGVRCLQERESIDYRVHACRD